MSDAGRFLRSRWRRNALPRDELAESLEGAPPSGLASPNRARRQPAEAGEPSAALERAERDCRLRAAMLLLEPELPADLAELLLDAIVARVHARRGSGEADPAAVRTAYYALLRAAGVRAKLRQEPRNPPA